MTRTTSPSCSETAVAGERMSGEPEEERGAIVATSIAPAGRTQPAIATEGPALFAAAHPSMVGATTTTLRGPGGWRDREQRIARQRLTATQYQHGESTYRPGPHGTPRGEREGCMILHRGYRPLIITVTSWLFPSRSMVRTAGRAIGTVQLVKGDPFTATMRSFLRRPAL